MELHKGDKYKDVDGTEFQVFGALSVYKVKCYPVDKPVAIRHLSA